MIVKQKVVRKKNKKCLFARFPALRHSLLLDYQKGKNRRVKEHGHKPPGASLVFIV
jgi:hypothetical protein